MHKQSRVIFHRDGNAPVVRLIVRTAWLAEFFFGRRRARHLRWALQARQGAVYQRKRWLCPAIRGVAPLSLSSAATVGRFVHLYGSLTWDDSYSSREPPGGANLCDDGSQYVEELGTQTATMILAYDSASVLIKWLKTWLRHFFTGSRSVSVKLPKFCSSATRPQRRRPESRLRRPTLPRPVLYESSFWRHAKRLVVQQ